MRPVEKALEDSLEKWRPVTPILRVVRPPAESLTIVGGRNVEVES
jgi:hypothetical protein